MSKELPKDWKWVKLGEVCNIHQGYGFPKKLQGSQSGKYPFYKVGDISKNVKAGYRYLELCDNFIDEKILRQLKAKPYPVNTIVFAKIGEALKLNRRAIISKLGIVDNNAIGLKAIESYCTDLFLFHFFATVKLEDYSRATTVPSVRKSDIEEIQIPLPPKPTQLAIVAKIEELFSELDKGIEQLKTAQQSVLKWAFEGKLSESGFTGLKDEQDERQNKKSGKSLHPENSDSDKGELPKGWKWVKLGDVCKNVEYGSATKSKKEGKVPVLRMGNMQNGIFDWSDLVYSDDDTEIKKYLLKKNDVLFNRTNSAEWVGKTSIYKGERPAIFAGYLIRINRIENLINANYLTYYLNSLDAKKYGNSVRSFGVNQSNINGTKLKSYPIPLAPIYEQKMIVEIIESRFSVADKMEESINQSLQQAEALRQSILKKAFEGKFLNENPVLAKVIPIERKVLACWIIHLNYDHKYFGLTKFQKTLYLCEQYAEVEYETNYEQERAGPYDREFTLAFRKEIIENDIFQEETKVSLTHFIPGSNAGIYSKDYPKYFRNKGNKIKFVLQLLKDKTLDEAELIATIYAVWNNMIILKKAYNISAIIEAVYNWSPEKMKYSKEDISSMAEWMKEKNFVPIGFDKMIK